MLRRENHGEQGRSWSGLGGLEGPRKWKKLRGMPDSVILPANVGGALLCLGFILGPGSGIFAFMALEFPRGGW